MSLPKINASFAEGNLLRSLGNVDGYGAMCLTGSSNLGTVQTFFSLADAVEAGITEQAEPYAYRQIKEFYTELGGNQKLYVMLVTNTVSMADMLDATDNDGALKLCTQTNREVSLLAVGRNPAVGYDGGAGFFDSDVTAALTASTGFGEHRRQDNNFLAVLIEGRVENAEAALPGVNINASEADYAGVVVGGSANDGSASIGTALGRAVKFGAHIKLGKVADGPTSLNQVYIGDTLVEERSDLSAIHALGVISFMQHGGKAGYYFGRDFMANTGDYAQLTRRRVVNKAATIATLTLIEDLEGEVAVDTEGKIATDEIADMQGRTEAQIDAEMSEQISGRSVVINPDQDIINSGELQIDLGVVPLGYKSQINIGIGLQNSL